MQVEDESGSEEEVLEIDEESVEIDAEEDLVVSEFCQRKREINVVLEELGSEDVSWVLVLYEREKFLEQCLSKTNEECRVNSLGSELDDDGKRTGKLVL